LTPNRVRVIHREVILNYIYDSTSGSKKGGTNYEKRESLMNLKSKLLLMENKELILNI